MNYGARKSNVEIRYQTKMQLRGNWGKVVGTYFAAIGLMAISYVVFVFMMIFQSRVMTILGFMCLLSIAPIIVGMKKYFLMFERGEKTNTSTIFQGYQYTIKSIFVCILQNIIICLWTGITVLFLGVMGIIKFLDYALVYYIVYDYPDLNPFQVLKESKKMMYGYKWELMGMYIYFLFLSFVCVFTLGIGYIWLFPYIEVVKANFYENIKVNRSNYNSVQNQPSYQNSSHHNMNNSGYNPGYTHYNGQYNNVGGQKYGHYNSGYNVGQESSNNGNNHSMNPQESHDHNRRNDKEHQEYDNYTINHQNYSVNNQQYNHNSTNNKSNNHQSINNHNGYTINNTGQHNHHTNHQMHNHYQTNYNQQNAISGNVYDEKKEYFNNDKRKVYNNHENSAEEEDYSKIIE